MPDWIDLAFVASNRRNIYEHPYRSVLIEDNRKMLGDYSEKVISYQQGIHPLKKWGVGKVAL